VTGCGTAVTVDDCRSSGSSGRRGRHEERLGSPFLLLLLLLLLGNTYSVTELYLFKFTILLSHCSICIPIRILNASPAVWRCPFPPHCALSFPLHFDIYFIFSYLTGPCNTVFTCVLPPFGVLPTLSCEESS